jgi:2-dehydro-3-deoxyphosphogluconate aldolase/(4S)-4-hydroxy-2-oxoglutarate aldolase
VRSLLGPFPNLLLMPSGGVETSRDALQAWFDAGVAAVSVGGSLISSEILRSGNWELLESETRRVVDIVAELRRDRPVD